MRRIGLGIMAAALLMAAPAHAARVEAGGNYRTGYWIKVTAPPGQTNTIALTRASWTLYQPPLPTTGAEIDNMIDIVDLTANVSVGGTCVKLTPRSARCPSGDVTVDLGDGNDQFHTPPELTEPVTVFGGPGSDVLQAEDATYSELHGGAGDDRLLVPYRSGWQFYTCGDGADTVVRDDLALHRDDFEPASACESDVPVR